MGLGRAIQRADEASMTEEPSRLPKKSEMLDVRLPHGMKQEFLGACRRAGRTASDVVRESIQTFIDAERGRPEPQPGKLIAMIPKPVRKRRYLVGATAALAIGATALLPSAAADPDFRAAFGRIDKNGDGVVTPEEFFGDEIKPAMISETRQAIQHRPETYDSAASKVVFESYVSIFPREAGDPKGEWGWELSISGGLRHPQPGIEVTTEELRRMADFDPLAATFINIDKNGDDRVNFVEFESAFIQLLPRAFNRLDGDHDGFVSQAEFIKTADVLDVSEQHLKASFPKLDKDGDGKVSLAEYMLKK